MASVLVMGCPCARTTMQSQAATNTAGHDLCDQIIYFNACSCHISMGRPHRQSQVGPPLAAAACWKLFCRLGGMHRAEGAGHSLLLKACTCRPRVMRTASVTMTQLPEQCPRVPCTQSKRAFL